MTTDALNLDAVTAAIQKWLVAGSGLADDRVWFAFEKRPRPPAPYIEVALQLIRPIAHDWSVYEANPLVLPTLTVSAVSAAADTLTIAAHGLANGDGPIHLASTGTLPGGLLAATDYWVIYVDANTIKLATSYVRTGGQMPLGAGNPVTPINLTTAGSGVITAVSTVDTVPAGKEVIHHAQGLREVTLHLECFAPEGAGYLATQILSNVTSSLQLYVYDLDEAGCGISDMGQAFSQGGVQLLEGRRGGILEPRAMWDLVIYLASDITGFATIIETIDASIQVESEGGTPLPAIPVHIA